MFKDSRAIYARIAYEMFSRRSSLENVDEDVFFMEILGHDDETLNYTISNSSWPTLKDMENTGANQAGSIAAAMTKDSPERCRSSSA
ncbi:hypothetical protein AB2H60_24685 (plasmid) [Escherichia coli]